MDYVPLEKVLTFIDSKYAPDKQIYAMVSSLYDSKERFEIQWRVDQNPPWRFKNKNESNDCWIDLTTHELIPFLNSKRADLVSFEIQIKSKVLNQAIYADMLYNQIVKLMGKDAVEYALDEHKAFENTLIETIRNLLGDREKQEAKSRLKLVKEEDI